MRTLLHRLVFLTTAISQLSLADSNNNPAKLLQDIQNQLQDFGPRKTECLTCDGGDIRKNPIFSDCVKLLCPQTSDNPSGMKMLMDLEESALHLIPDVKTKLLADLQANFAAKSQEQLQSIKDLRAAIQSGDTSISAPFKTFHNFMFLSAALSKIQMKEGSSLDNMQVDFDKMKPNLPELTAEDAKWLPIALNELLKTPAMKTAMGIGSDSPDHIFKKRYPNLSLNEAVQKEAAEIKVLTADTHEKIFKPMGLSKEQFDLYFDMSTINEVSEGTRTDEAAFDAFLSQAAEFRLMNEVFAHPEKQPWILQREPFNLDQIVKANGILEKLDQAEKYLSNKDTIAALRQKAETDCVDKFARQVAALPTKEQIAAAKQQSKDVLSKLKENVFTKFSVHTSQMLNSRFKNVDTILPLDRASFEADFLKSLRQDTAISVTPKISDASKKQFALLSIYEYYGKDWSAENTSGPLNFCENRYNLPFIDDRANQQTEVFYASWVSVRYPNFGKAVMSHEMGHIVDSFMKAGDASHVSFQKYIETNKCITARHPEADSKQSITYTVNTKGPMGERVKEELQVAQYNSEDFADLISAMAFPKINLACGLMFGGEQDPNLSIVNSSAGDPHSSALFRALNINGIANESLPKVCQDALAVTGAKTDFSSCLDHN